VRDEQQQQSKIMQTTTVKGTGENPCRSYCERIVFKTFERRPPRTKDNSCLSVHRTGFLKQRLGITPAKPDMDGNLIEDYYTDQNYNHLLECAVHYAGLLGKTFKTPKGTAHERFCMIYHRFVEILPKGHELNLDIIHDKMKWIVYRIHEWNFRIFYWMPVDFINELTGKIREIAMSFMHLFIRKNHLSRFSDCYESDFLFEIVGENINFVENNYKEKRKNNNLLQSYQDGEIAAFLNELYTLNPANVAVLLEEYTPANPLEDKLICCFKKGLPFISGKNSIMYYDYNPEIDNYPNSQYYDDEYEPFTLDRIVRYVYNLDDCVINELENICNQHIQETYAVQPTSFQILDTCSELFTPDDYPERFSEWFYEMIEITKKIKCNE